MQAFKDNPQVQPISNCSNHLPRFTRKSLRKLNGILSSPLRYGIYPSAQQWQRLLQIRGKPGLHKDLVSKAKQNKKTSKTDVMVHNFSPSTLETEWIPGQPSLHIECQDR